MPTTTTTDVPLLTSREVCDRLGIDRSTLTRWVQSGRIEAAQKLPGLRGAYLFTETALNASRE